MKTKHILFLLFLISYEAHTTNYECILASKKYEKIYNLPENLLLSVALTESGKKADNGEFISWPWTVNVKGKGKYFKNKNDAVNFVKKYTNRGRKNIDLGCMQVNYMYHPKAFGSFQEAFDPEKNVEWSAKTLNTLYNKFGTWREAVGYYHSYRTTKRKKYSAKVFNTLLNIKNIDKYNIIQKKALELKKISRNDIAYNENHIPIIKEAMPNSKIAKDNKLNNIKNTNVVPNNSPYIMARMEKVNFFRNYFYNLAKN